MPKRIRAQLRRIRRLNAVAFYDPTNFPPTNILETEWHCIREEFSAFDENKFQRWPDNDAYEGNWDVFGLIVNDERLEENCRIFPETMRIVDQIPECKGAGFSVLSPGSRILPHTDVSDTILRCHLGIFVPDGCRIRVGREVRHWEEGKRLIFDTSLEHEVWHEGETPRVALVLDILKPGASHDYALSKNMAKKPCRSKRFSVTIVAG